MNSAPTTAASGWVWKLSAAQGGSAGSGDSRARLGHAVATNSRRNVSAPGAGSLAATVSPRARNSAVQLAPIVPVPMTATRRKLLPAIYVPSRVPQPASRSDILVRRPPFGKTGPSVLGLPFGAPRVNYRWRLREKATEAL